MKSKIRRGKAKPWPRARISPSALPTANPGPGNTGLGNTGPGKPAPANLLPAGQTDAERRRQNELAVEYFSRITDAALRDMLLASLRDALERQEAMEKPRTPPPRPREKSGHKG